MSLRALLVAAIVLARAGAVAAEEDERFFLDRAESKRDRRSTSFDGSLTSTTFYYSESGVQAAPLTDGATGPRSASPVGRLFTDLRGQLNAKHISGSKVDFRVDVRGRYDATATNPDSSHALPFQSGTLYGQELELRELWVKRDGREFDFTVGRQFVLELAATKFDGVKVERDVTKQWKYIGFAGLYPTRGSRDLRDDYPKSFEDPSQAMLGDAKTKRIMPLAGGMGAAYRYARYYGGLGAVGIMPLARDQSGIIETPRIFATANGYWRKTESLDLFHYLVVDVLGSAAFGLTNLTLGLNYQPSPPLRISAQVTRVDTETLNVQAITQLEDPDPNTTNAIQNNVAVARISQESARLGVSASFKENRFEVSTTGTLRRRPQLEVKADNGTDQVVFAAAQAADIQLSFVDRRSWNDARIGGTLIRSFGVGDANLYRTKSTIVRLEASKEAKQGQVEVDGNLTYLYSVDDNQGVACDVTNLATCYGSAKVTSYTLGGLLYYRFTTAWFLVASANAGVQSLTASDAAGTPVAQPAVTVASVFLRLAYRF